ncbi:glycosyltransferase [Pelotomaculum propionicicum]|uniref:N-acetyl-alpha-D-glucosaminyl L-malate synthase n=1 Tax=Pelotomaculum propionicicum TaxID=258475 RepID=A0A4Y7RUD1_9FIRM|nr:glycosyltransferase [Pelotomaculum propionicicum]NLI14046.1 glycosyltransferase family 4 protein [Peptococcaceae bacterium]TEB12585.1 N-acetyl-alpha-D-glucosaminyl L-malate synthase [Pelotomaculum propionicicum]
MQIDQIIPSMRHGDDISNAVLVLQKIIKDLGCESDIFTQTGQQETGTKDLSSLDGERDNIIYHMFIGSRAAKTLAGIKAKRKVLFYHGIMPPEYFENHPSQIYMLGGREELKKLKNQFEFAFTTTKYLEGELYKEGYGETCVLPLPVDLEEYDQEPDLQLMKAYDDDYTNILFVGQITPNKKLEDTISVFNYYHKRLNPKSRLFLVGSFSSHAGYCQKLLALIKELEIKNVFLTGRTSFKKLLAYYRLSRVFLCMSEYEGFSTPLIEAMYLKVPIVAFNRASVPEILGESGCLINDKDVRETARLLDRIVNDHTKRKEMIRLQSKRVTAFLPEKVFPLYRKVFMLAFS